LPKQEISIYPNPFHEELKLAINSKEKGTAKVVIYSLVTSQTYYSHEFSLNFGMNIFRLVPNVPTGAYVIKVQIGDDVVLNKIIKD
jgi:fibronectin type 3 domain-containing protein